MPYFDLTNQELLYQTIVQQGKREKKYFLKSNLIFMRLFFIEKSCFPNLWSH